MINVLLYKPECKEIWNAFIQSSKNGIFMFYRNYMEYHSNKFQDYSLLFYENEKLIAVLPASLKDDVIVSHGGLTFGGVVADSRMTTKKMLEVFQVLKVFLEDNGIKKIVYKALPYIYHKIPSEEDRYVIFLNNGRLIKQEPCSLVFLDNKLKFCKGKKYGISKAKKADLKVLKSKDYDQFFKLEKARLNERYAVDPVHTASEMNCLANNFPENIKLYAVLNKSLEMVAGTILYLNNKAAHAQYIASNEEGRENGAIDYLMDYLINDLYKDYKYFDFGISTEQGGHYLNEGLIAQKEMLGGRTICFSTYEIDV
ncbi:MAG: GNAT family N-acetyltransferase [Puniceicoccales bacterium]|jgi:hypothetical protein|nr:GNAT family N-acetyltransferase [Puniceicoccales bacterium]